MGFEWALLESAVLTEGLVFCRWARRISRGPGRHLGVRPPKNVRTATKDRYVPNPADFSEEFSAGFHADSIFRKYRCEDGMDPRRSVEEIVSVLPCIGID